MKQLAVIGSIVTLFVLVSCAKITNNDNADDYLDHPILGTWAYEKNGCDEKYEFTADGFRFVESNEELVTAIYEISDIVSEKGVYLLKDTVIEDNGKPACSGSTSDMTGDVVELLILIQHELERFTACFDPGLTICIGPFVKVN